MDCYEANAKKTALDKAIIAIFTLFQSSWSSLVTATEVVAKTSFYNLV